MNYLRIKTFALLIICIISFGCVTNYYFMIERDEYEEYSIKRKNVTKGSKIIDYSNENWPKPGYETISSLPFPNTDSATWINVEFLREPNNHHKGLVNKVGNSNFLLCKIELHEKIKEIVDIKVNPIYDNKSLELKKIYKDIGFPNSNSYYSEVEDFDNSYDNQDEPLRLIFVFRKPVSFKKRIFTKKANLYSKIMNEIIIIKYIEKGELKERKFIFNLEWNYSSFWVT